MCLHGSDDGTSDAPRLQPIEIEEYQAALAIQRIARGRQARHYVERRRTKFNKAATRIQARARGMRDRKKVTWAWKLHFGAIAMQRIVRGRLARVRVATMRKFRKDTRSVRWPNCGLFNSVSAACSSLHACVAASRPYFPACGCVTG